MKFTVFVIPDVDFDEFTCPNCDDVGNFKPFVNDYAEWTECDSCGTLYIRQRDVPETLPDGWHLGRAE